MQAEPVLACAPEDAALPERHQNGAGPSLDVPVAPPPAVPPSLQRPTSLVWLRRDLRLDDNPALVAALKTGGKVVRSSQERRQLLSRGPRSPSASPHPAPPTLQVLVFIWAPGEDGEFAPGHCSRWWLHKSLRALQGSCKKLGGSLCLRSSKQARGAPPALLNIPWRRFAPVASACRALARLHCARKM